MSIEKTLIGSEVQEILGTPNGAIGIVYEIIIHTVNDDIKIDKLKTVEVMKDYNVNIGSYIYIDALVPMGDMVKDIYPYRNNLEVSLIEIDGTKKSAKRYKLILLNVNEDLGSGRYKKLTRKELNDSEALNITGQCLDRDLEAIRLKSVSGIFRSLTVSELIKGLFLDEVKKVKVNGNVIDLTITMVGENNDRVYEHIIVPNGTKLIDLPTYLQETKYGVYNGSIGLFIEHYRKGTYFKECSDANGECVDVLNISIYPLYRTDVVEDAKHKLIIYGIPDVKYSQIENTYMIDGADIKIISNDDSKKINESDTIFADVGTGYINLDVAKVMHRPVAVTEKAVFNSSDVTNTKSNIKERTDASAYKVVKNPTDNLYNVRSSYLKANGDMFQLQWKFSDAKYLLPGMAVIYIYLGSDNEVKRVNGVLQSHFSLCNVSSKMTNSILNIFLERSPDELN